MVLQSYRDRTNRSIWYYNRPKRFKLHYNGDYGKNITIEVPSADLGITKTVNSTAPRYGDTIKFTLNATNIGPNTAESVVVVDVLPTGLTYLSSTPTGVWDATARTVTWNLGTMAAGSSQTLEIIAQVATTNAILINTATITGTVYDPYTANNTANATVTVAPEADLRIIKVVNQTVVNYLDTVKFTLTVANLGPDTATNVVVTDVLPAGLEFVSSTASQGTYTNGVWTIGNLANGATATLDIIARVMISDGSITNVATVTSDIYDPNPSNNRDSVTIKVGKKPTPKPPKPPGPGEVPMQPTGTSLSLMLLAVLSIIGGFAVSRKV
ncbi:MAG: DUF11 domain-containing protein [Methanobacteriaceae archaeon]|nr:DUF11 domain-containing protein [Methanobacteriaceae archaeon]